VHQKQVPKLPAHRVLVLLACQKLVQLLLHHQALMLAACQTQAQQLPECQRLALRLLQHQMQGQKLLGCQRQAPSWWASRTHQVCQSCQTGTPLQLAEFD
jgi:7-cyano-7-deazaguanine synthase in queuosine biosynthesis